MAVRVLFVEDPSAVAPSVCLNMIVKNEAGVIRRCLESVRPFINHWVIVDTGSTDRTREIIRETFADVPGELYERPWKNFGHNRSEAMELARGKSDYILVIDADEKLVGEPGFVMPSGADAYLVLYSFADSAVTWHRATFVKAALPWRYQGVLHEYLDCGRPPQREKLEGIRIVSHTDGARNKDPVEKYRNDAKILEQGLIDEPDNARYVFYLAQSYRDAQDLEKAIEVYERRVAMGGWDEEVYYSLLQIAMLKERAKHSPASIVSAYLRAYDFRPSRAESLVELAAHYRSTSEWPLAEMFARTACGIAHSPDILFVDTASYTWRALDELSIATYYTKKYDESAALCRRLLDEGALPIAHRRRVQENLNFALKNLGKARTAPETVDIPAAPAPVVPSPKELEGTRIPYEACPLCESKAFAEERLGEAIHHPLYKPELPAQIRWMRCKACGHAFTDGYFSARGFELLFSGSNAHQRPGADLHQGRKVSARIVEKVREALGAVRGRWLDVGFGNGSLLGTAAEYGFDVVGLDLRTENVEWMNARGLEARAVEFVDYRPEIPLTVISLADTLEHMAFPKPVLLHARELLADDGVLFLSMPNEDAFVWRALMLTGENPYVGELEHFHNFGRKRLASLLEECGFTEVSYGINERYLMGMEVIAKKRLASA